MSVPHPIPYQGSKRGLAARILACLPPDTDRLVEPFAGSAALSLACAQAGKARSFVLNDINQPLIDLWREILGSPDGLADAYEELWNAQRGQERAYYDRIRGLFNQCSQIQLHPQDDTNSQDNTKPEVKAQEHTLQSARFLYLLARCVKASVRYNAKGEFNQGPDNRRRGARPPRMRAHLLAASALLQGRTELHSQDYRQTLANVGERDVVYLDPPYQGVCGSRDRRYFAGIVVEEFADALCALNRNNTAFLLSYDGQTGNRSYGAWLPPHLNLTHVLLDAGPSSQSTLLGRAERTTESLYLSPALTARLHAFDSQPWRRA